MNKSGDSLARHFPRASLTIVGLLLLAACATPADPKHMAVTQASIAPGFPEALQHAMCVRSVSGGENTNPLWVSEVGNPEFREALTSSLSNAGLLSPQNSCKYFVDVNLLGVSQPTVGVSMTVKSYANYKVYDGPGNPILLATISASYTAGAFDAFAGYVRIKHATEGSIRESISQFLDKLRTVKHVPEKGASPRIVGSRG
jgi:hypothetical protein